MEFNVNKGLIKKQMSCFMLRSDIADKVLELCPKAGNPGHERGKYNNFIETAVFDLLEKLDKKAKAEEAVKRRIASNAE